MFNSRTKKLITTLVGILLLISCSQFVPSELQSATSAPPSQPNVTSVSTSQTIVTSTIGQVSTTPTDQPFMLPGGRLLLAALASSGEFNQYYWLQLPDMTITPHSYLAGDYPARDREVTISPDLTHLAFGHEVYTKSGDDLYADLSFSVLLTDLEGDQTTQIGPTYRSEGITMALACGDEISWSANSQVFAFALSGAWNNYYEQEHHLYVYDLPSSQFKTITILTFSPSSFSLSPDGTQIAFTSFGEIPGLSLINVDGSSQHLIVEGWVNSNLVWHPDGKRIFFKTDQPELGIYTVDVSTGATTLITSTSDKANCLGLSPDFSLLAYDDGGIRVVNADGGEPLQLNRRENNSLVWSPDSQYIAYYSVFDPHVFVMDTAGNGKVSVYLDDWPDPFELIGWLP
jgi:Tol biopolymer transport system component